MQMSLLLPVYVMAVTDIETLAKWRVLRFDMMTVNV